MHIILLLIGLVGAVAGAAMAAMGAMQQTAPLAPTWITSGMVALTGGFVLIGLGAVVARLRRIVDLLGRQPVAPFTATDEKIEPMTLPRAAAAEPALRPPHTPASEAPTVGSPADTPPKAPGTEAPVVTAEPVMPKPLDNEPSLLDKTRDLFEKPVDALSSPVAPPVTAAPEPKVDPLPARDWRVNPNDRFAEPRVDTPSSLGSQTLAPPIVPPQERTPERSTPRVDMPGSAGSPRAEPSPAPNRSAAPTVLKSGVIEGMAYTLYSDGSIEAELAQGSMRFDSIPALRAYLRDIG